MSLELHRLIIWSYCAVRIPVNTHTVKNNTYDEINLNDSVRN